MVRSGYVVAGRAVGSECGRALHDFDEAGCSRGGAHRDSKGAVEYLINGPIITRVSKLWLEGMDHEISLLTLSVLGFAGWNDCIFQAILGILQNASCASGVLGILDKALVD